MKMSLYIKSLSACGQNIDSGAFLLVMKKWLFLCVFLGYKIAGPCMVVAERLVMYLLERNGAVVCDLKKFLSLLRNELGPLQ